MFFTKPSNLFFTLFLLTLQVLSVFAAPVALPVAIAAPAPVPKPIAPNTNNPTTLLGRIYHPAAANEANIARSASPEPIVLRAVDTGSTSTPIAQRDDETEALLNRAERFQRRMERRANRRQSSEGAQSA